MIKTTEREYMEIKEILYKSPSKISLTNGIHSLLRRADARERESADIIYRLCRTELDMDWIHPWIGLDWIGLGPMTAILYFFIYIFSILTTDKR